MNNSQYNNRLDKLNKIIEKQGNIYYYCPNVTHSLNKVSNRLIDKEISVCGRVIQHRNSKMFVIILNEGLDLQCYFDVKNKVIKDNLKLLDIGDFIFVEGIIKKSSTNVLTLFAQNFSFLAKCLCDAPDQYYIKKYEDIYQNEKRTIYLTFHKFAFRNVYLRFRISKYISNYFDSEDFIEVETPILQRIAGGATAKPFKTEYLDKHTIFDLRIAPELYLKRMIICGMKKIYEVAKSFRNEGLSVKHNPEFTMIEAYAVMWGLDKMIKFIINMIHYAINKLLINEINYLSNTQIDFLQSIKFKNVKYYKFEDIIIENFGSNITREVIIDELNKKEAIYNIDCNMSFEELCDDYISKIFIKKFSHNEIICVTHHPASLSPLAKMCEDSKYSKRFEIYIRHSEVADGYEEETNYRIQLEKFKLQKIQNNREYDYNYINAMMLGFPVTSGVGIGLDRLACIILGLKNIRDVISYTD